MIAPSNKLEIVSALSVPSGRTNDDRTGAAGNTAWVIDGATDFVNTPLIGADTDAAWLANLVNDWLAAHAADNQDDLIDMISAIADCAADAFDSGKLRKPLGRHEHPSAAGMIVRLRGHHLEYASIADCSLIVEHADGRTTIIGPEDDGGDIWLAQQIEGLHGQADDLTPTEIRKRLAPIVQAIRARMNLVPGYGVFSITRTPGDQIETGTIAMTSGTRILLATDGYMRFSEIYKTYAPAELLQKTFERGPEDMISELREIEARDAGCKDFPRLKPCDDATVLIAKVTGL